jgi:GNAT superfamily N-acetyltransferase
MPRHHSSQQEPASRTANPLAEMDLHPMTEPDLPRVLSAWNAILIHERLAEQRFRQVMLGDPNYEPEGVLVAKGESGELLGFSACALRREVAGKDGGGSQDDFDRAYLKGFFVVDGDAGDAAAKDLIGAVESYARAAGKQRLTVTEYGAAYVFPGLDVRYERLRGLLMRNGYQDFHTIECVAADLNDPAIPHMLKEAWATMSSEIKLIAPWEPSVLPAMRRFVAEVEMPAWFPIGWETRYEQPREHCSVLTKGGEIIAWAQFHPHKPTSGFGPILVLHRERGHNYGGLLLLESMTRAAQLGCERMLAQWANTGFYVRYGWNIVRRFAVLRKALR